MSYAIKSKTEGNFRRSGVEFLPDRWREIEKPTEAQLNEPALQVVKFSGRNDPALRGIPFVDEVDLAQPDEERPAPPELTPEAVNAFVEAQKAVIVAQSDIDALEGERARLASENQSLKTELAAEKHLAEEVAERHKKTTEDLKEKYESEIAELKKKK